MRLRILWIVLFEIFAAAVYGQSKRAKEWTGNLYAGYLLIHHPEMKYLQTGHAIGGGISWAVRTDGKDDWNHYYNFPTWGIDIDFYTLGSENLGTVVASRAFWDLPLNSKKSINFKMGFGAAFLSRPFDAETNINNSAIGSHINAALDVETYFRIKLSDKVQLKPGIAFHHYSNGALQMPNTGLNYLFIKTALSFSSGGFKDPERAKDQTIFKANHLRFGLSFGLKQGQNIQSDYYGIVNVFGNFERRISPKSIVGAELGMNYNASLIARTDDQTNTAVNYRAYLAGTYQLDFGKMGIRFQLGSYIAPAFKDDGNVFLRYHIYYDIGKFQFFGGLKSHYAKADHIEIGSSFRIL